MVAADFSRHVSMSPFQVQGEISPGKNALLHHTTAAFTPPRFDHKSFADFCPFALLGSALYAVLVHRLMIYASRFLPTIGRPHAVALGFARCGQLATGLAPVGVRPCWAHKMKGLFAPGSSKPGSQALLTSVNLDFLSAIKVLLS